MILLAYLTWTYRSIFTVKTASLIIYFTLGQLAILDGGVTLASGAGVSLPGIFRLATDKTLRDFFLNSRIIMGLVINTDSTYMG